MSMYIVTIERVDGPDLKGIRHSWAAVLLFIEENSPWFRVVIIHK